MTRDNVSTEDSGHVKYKTAVYDANNIGNDYRLSATKQ